jgi:hypothetical protein
MPPEGRGGGGSGVGQYCIMDGVSGDNQCYSWNDDVIAEFRRARWGGGAEGGG